MNKRWLYRFGWLTMIVGITTLGTGCPTTAGGGGGDDDGGDPAPECAVNDDCDDNDPCTTDSCGDDGNCATAPVECPDGQECDGETGDCADTGGGEGGGDPATGDAAAGETTYASDCMGCHGDPGDPPGPVGPGIAGADAEELAAHLTGAEPHAGGEFPELGEADYANMAAYLATF